MRNWILEHYQGLGCCDAREKFKDRDFKNQGESKIENGGTGEMNLTKFYPLYLIVFSTS
jgi:hypothetical protein